MIKYLQNEMIYDCKKQDNAVLFIDVNAQGILELDVVGKRLLSEFPNIALMYRAGCVQGLFTPGVIRYYEDNGFEFVLGCTMAYRAGKLLRDDPDAVLKATTDIIKRLGSEYKDRSFVSGILNRHLPIWGETSIRIASSGLDWSIYRE